MDNGESDVVKHREVPKLEGEWTVRQKESRSPVYTSRCWALTIASKVPGLVHNSRHFQGRVAVDF